jgi:Holliday junction resolvase-like predicted endonuclease
MSIRDGDVSEAHAGNWLYDHGWKVLYNPKRHGPIDLVASKDGEVRLVQVGTGRRYTKVSGEQVKSHGKNTASKRVKHFQGGVTHILIVYYDPLELEWVDPLPPINPFIRRSYEGNRSV